MISPTLTEALVYAVLRHEHGLLTADQVVQRSGGLVRAFQAYSALDRFYRAGLAARFEPIVDGQISEARFGIPAIRPESDYETALHTLVLQLQEIVLR